VVPGIRHVNLTGPLYDALHDLYRLDMTSAQESIRAVVVDGGWARLLLVPKGSLAFFVERVSYVREKPVEVPHSLIRGDRYLYSARLEAADAGRRTPPLVDPPIRLADEVAGLASQTCPSAGQGLRKRQPNRSKRQGLPAAPESRWIGTVTAQRLLGSGP
jgi:hypothetical protein